MTPKENPRRPGSLDGGKNEALKNPNKKAAEKQEIILKAALSYAEMGLSVIPVASNKKPAIKSWIPYQKESASEKQIIHWWGNNPRANIGIVTGAISNLTVVDLDSPG